MIDVIIPAYNCKKTINRTLASLVAQTDKNFEVTIVDDCSTEDWKYILNDYKSLLDICYIRNSVNVGCGMSRQVGIDHTINPFFCFLDSDDMFMPYTVAMFNDIIRQKNTADMYHSYFYNSLDDGLKLIENGYTWCHGKLYSRKFIERFNIRNSSDVKWADDSFFNSMCVGLGTFRIINIPMYVWTDTHDSIMKCKNEYRDSHVVGDFINAMYLAFLNVRGKNGNTSSFIPSIQSCIENRKHTKDDEEYANFVIEKIAEACNGKN